MQTTQQNGAAASQQHAPTNTNYGQNYNLNCGYAMAQASVSTIDHALTFIDATDRDTWIKCGMAIKAEVGDSGFEVWDRWSSTSDNYSARAVGASWKSFDDSGGITIATVFGLAKKTAIATPPRTGKSHLHLKRSPNVNPSVKRLLML